MANLADIRFPADGGAPVTDQCPLCLQQARQLGAVILATPGQIAGTAGSEPITGAACVDCLGLLAMMLDGLRGGKIRQLADKLVSAGAVKVR